MKERRDGGGGVEFKFPLDTGSKEGESNVAMVTGAIREGLEAIHSTHVSTRPDALCTWVTVKCPEGVSDEVKRLIDEKLWEVGVVDPCRGAIRDVLVEGDGDPVFYPRSGRGGRFGGGGSSGDGGGAAYQC